MQFGTKRSEVSDDFSGNYLRSFKEGSTQVRFLEEPDDWTAYREHFNKERRAFPCTGDRNTCPGCTSDDEEISRSSRKYATHVKVIKGDYVAPYKIPVSLAKRMFARAERNDGTITDRDYLIVRTGKGLDTDYDVDPGDKYAVNTSVLLKDAPDIEEIFTSMFEENAPGAKQDEVKAKANAKVDKDFEEEAFPSEPADEAGDTVIDEDALFDMNLADLLELARRNKIDVPDNPRKSSLIRLIVESSEAA